MTVIAYLCSLHQNKRTKQLPAAEYSPGLGFDSTTVITASISPRPIPQIDMDDIAEYYRPGSRLMIELSGHNSCVTVNVLRPIIPFTMSQVLLVEIDFDGIQNLPLAACAILKIYDPRFICPRTATGPRPAGPWSLSAETSAAQQFKRDPKYTFSPFPGRDDLVGWEIFYLHWMENSFWPEKTVYDRLVSLQGSGIPRCYASGTILLSDRAISPHILLLEYIPDAFSIRDIEVDREQTKDITQGLSTRVAPYLARSMLDTVASFARLGVTQNDSHARNFLFSPRDQPTRAVVIDFGEGYARKDESDDEWNAYALGQEDVVKLRCQLEHALGIDLGPRSIDRSLWRL